MKLPAQPARIPSNFLRITAGILLAGILLSLTACGGAVPTAAPPAVPTATAAPTSIPTPVVGKFYVNAAQSLGAINPLVYGSNYGPWLFVTLDMRAPAKAGRITSLRYPGGNWGDLNDLDEWQIDQFIALCREMGSEPTLSVRLKGGTVDKATALVRYVNLTKKYQVRYWSIGNEPSLFPEYDTVRYNREWREYALAMRAVDANIQFVGPDTHQFTAVAAANPKDKNGKDWLEEFLIANGDLVNIVAVHRYAFPTSSSGSAPSKADLRTNSREWDQIIPALRSLVIKSTGRDIPLAVTEVNSSWAGNAGGEATMDSHYNAIWWGDVLARLIRQRVDLVQQFALVGDFGLMDKYQVYPIYYVYKLYQQFGSELVYSSTDQAELSIIAARRPDGSLTVMLINLASTEKSYPLQIDGYNLTAPAEVWRLDAQTKAEKTGSLALTSGKAITLPAESMTLLVIPAK